MRSLVFLLASGMALSGAAWSDGAIHQTSAYRPEAYVTIRCAAMYVCTVKLNSDEAFRTGFSGDRDPWYPHSMYGGTPPVPYLVYRPYRAGLRTNAVVPTTRRVYNFLLVSTSGDAPTEVTFVYPLQRAGRAAAPQAHPTPRPMTVARQMDYACASMGRDFYQEDARPAEWRPVRACHDLVHTYIQLPEQAPATDLPVLVEMALSGDRVLNYVYDAPSRTYRIDGVPAGVVLTISAGKKGMRLRCLLVKKPFVSVAPPQLVTPKPQFMAATPAPIETDPVDRRALLGG